MVRRILIPVDGSKIASECFSKFLNEYYQEGDYFIIAHFYNAPHLPAMTLKSPLSVPWEEWGEIMKSTTQRVMKILQNEENKILERRIKGHTYSRVGLPSEGIIHYCKTQEVDFVVMAAQQHSTLSRLILGSTTDYVVHHSPVPVMVFPPLETI